MTNGRIYSGMPRAEFCLVHSEEFPFNDHKATDKAEKAALAVLTDLTDRRGIKHEFNGCDPDVKEEIVTTMASIIRAVYGG